MRHTATLTLTGWVTESPQGPTLAGVFLPKLGDWVGQRVTVRGHPWTTELGELSRFHIPRGRIRPARRPNGVTLHAVGHLIRLDSGLGTLRLGVWPAQPHVRPVILTLQATTPVLNTLPLSAQGAEIWGRMLPGKLLLAEGARPVHAPKPPGHERWGKRGRATRNDAQRAALALAEAELNAYGPGAVGLEDKVRHLRQQLGLPEHL